MLKNNIFYSLIFTTNILSTTKLTLVYCSSFSSFNSSNLFIKKIINLKHINNNSKLNNNFIIKNNNIKKYSSNNNHINDTIINKDNNVSNNNNKINIKNNSSNNNNNNINNTNINKDNNVKYINNNKINITNNIIRKHNEEQHYINKQLYKNIPILIYNENECHQLNNLNNNNRMKHNKEKHEKDLNMNQTIENSNQKYIKEKELTQKNNQEDVNMEELIEDINCQLLNNKSKNTNEIQTTSTRTSPSIYNKLNNKNKMTNNYELKFSPLVKHMKKLNRDLFTFCISIPCITIKDIELEKIKYILSSYICKYKNIIKIHDYNQIIFEKKPQIGIEYEKYSNIKNNKNEEENKINEQHIDLNDNDNIDKEIIKNANNEKKINKIEIQNNKDNIQNNIMINNKSENINNEIINKTNENIDESINTIFNKDINKSNEIYFPNEPCILKVILLNPDRVNSFESFGQTNINILNQSNINENNFGFVKFQLKYENFTSEQILKAILPDEEMQSSFTTIGNILQLNLREELSDYKYIIGEILLDKIPNCCTVINKLNIIDSTYRNFQVEILAGDNNMITCSKENGCKFYLDISKVYWNSRLSTEHQRIVNLISKNDIVYDVFAGVGPFTIPSGKKGAKIFANDLNPDSYYWLNKNIQSNIKNNNESIEIFNLDAQIFIETIIKKHMLQLIENYKNEIKQLEKNKEDKFDYNKDNNESNKEGEKNIQEHETIDKIVHKSDIYYSKIHIIMNLPASSLSFVKYFQFFTLHQYEDFVSMFKHIPRIYIYCFKPKINRDTKEKITNEQFIQYIEKEYNIKLNYEEKINNKDGRQLCLNQDGRQKRQHDYNIDDDNNNQPIITFVRNVSPNKDMMRINIKFNKNIFVKQEEQDDKQQCTSKQNKDGCHLKNDDDDDDGQKEKKIQKIE